MASWLAGRRGLAMAVAVLAAGGVAAMSWPRAAAPSGATADVVVGDFVDVVELHGDVRPVKSITVTAPLQAGDLQILTLAPNGSSIKKGDVVVSFDPATLRRTIQEKESALRQAEHELEQAKAQATITTGADGTTVLHSQYDVDRARLGLTDDELIVSKMDAQKAQLALADAEQRLREAEVKEGANRQSSATGFTAQEAKIAKVKADLSQAQNALGALQVRAPVDGVVSILPNWRASSPMGAPQEFRAGDRAWSGAEILELPDLSSVHMAARLDESDRGRVEAQQPATIRVDAIADHEYRAAVTDVSVLAKVDFSSWPPPKNFDVNLTFTDPDARLRPGMSATARISVGRIPQVLLVPAGAVFSVDGRATIYRVTRRGTEPVVIDVIKRGKDQAAVRGDVRAGDRIALAKPDEGTGSK